MAAMRTSSPNYYQARSTKMLRGYDRFAARALPVMSERYGEPFAREVLAEARREFEAVLPDLSYIGGRANYFTPVIVVNGWVIGLFRAMSARGKDAREVIRICAAVTDVLFASIPTPLARLLGRLGFSSVMKRALRRQAKLSELRRFPEDFVYRFKEGGEDDWELEFSECAVNKLYDAQNVRELKPFCNFFDVTYSRYLGMGIDAHQTIGLGCDTCRLRYKHGRATAIPAALQGVLPGTDSGAGADA